MFPITGCTFNCRVLQFRQLFPCLAQKLTRKDVESGQGCETGQIRFRECVGGAEGRYKREREREREREGGGGEREREREREN